MRPWRFWATARLWSSWPRPTGSAVSRELAESCLAHVVKNTVEAAYRRSDLLEQRREIMNAWARYLA